MQKRNKPIFWWTQWGYIGDYGIWYYGTAGSSTYWNLAPRGERPQTYAGYKTLDSLLQLKGLNRDDCEQLPGDASIFNPNIAN